MSNLKQSVMVRVHAIRLMRPFVSTGAMASVLVLVSAYAISREVWVAMVLANMPPVQDVAALTRFFASAFLNTSFIVQAFSVVALGSVVWLAREAASAIGLVPKQALA